MNRRNFLTAILATPFISAIAPGALAAGHKTIDLGGQPLSVSFLKEISREQGALVMNKRMRNLLSASSRNPATEGQMVWDKNEFGQRIMKLGDVPIIPTDYTGGPVVQQVIDFEGPEDDLRTEILVLSPEAAKLALSWETDWSNRVDAAGMTDTNEGPYDYRGMPDVAGINLLKSRSDVLVLKGVPKKALIA